MLAIRLVGSALGAGAVAVLLVTGRPETEMPQLGAAIAVRVASGGAIEARVPGGGPALSAGSLLPGAEPLKGRLLLINHGPRPIRVSLNATTPAGGPIDPEVAAALRLRAGARGELADGALSGLQPSSEADYLGPESGLLIPAKARRGLPLELELEPDELPPGTLAGEHISLVLVPLRQVL